MYRIYCSLLNFITLKYLPSLSARVPALLTSCRRWSAWCRGTALSDSLEWVRDSLCVFPRPADVAVSLYCASRWLIDSQATAGYPYYPTVSSSTKRLQIPTAWRIILPLDFTPHRLRESDLSFKRCLRGIRLQEPLWMNHTLSLLLHCSPSWTVFMFNS